MSKYIQLAERLKHQPGFIAYHLRKNIFKQAEELGVPPETLSRIMMCRLPTTPENWAMLSQYFGLTEQQLLWIKRQLPPITAYLNTCEPASLNTKTRSPCRKNSISPK